MALVLPSIRDGSIKKKIFYLLSITSGPYISLVPLVRSSISDPATIVLQPPDVRFSLQV